MNSGVHDTSSVAIEDSLFVRLARHAVVAFLGAVFAVILYKIWSLDGRWFYVSIAALIMLSVAGFSAPRFSDKKNCPDLKGLALLLMLKDMVDNGPTCVANRIRCIFSPHRACIGR